MVLSRETSTLSHHEMLKEDLLTKMQHNKVFNAQMHKYHQTPLMIAAGIGDLPLVKQLIEELHADLEAKDTHGWSALIYAAAMHQFSVVKYLLSRGARIEAQNEETLHALMSALRNIWPLKHA